MQQRLMEQAQRTNASYFWGSGKAADLSYGNSTHIPCLFFQYQNGSSKCLIYFHGNAEDIGLSYEMLDHLRTSLKINIIAVEYPSYGIYQDQGGCSHDKIISDAEDVFKFILKETRLQAKDIILFGRSLGSGPSSYLAAKFQPGAMILMSGYTSIRSIVKSKVGSLLGYLVQERFENITLMPKVFCPTFILHGQKDALIPYSQAQELEAKCGG